MTDLKWQDPAPTNHNKHNTKWASVADQLRKRPGQWALVAEGLKHAVYATYINKGRISAFAPSGDFEGTSRKTDEGFDIYARYIGD